MQKKILKYFTIEGTPGGNQEWLPEWDMNMGGCAAVTACDVCIYLSRLEKFRSIYPFDSENLSKPDFIKFASVMKPFLSPRYHGIDFLETYICGFYDYLSKIKNNSLKLKFEGISGNVSYENFADAIINQLDRDLPVPCLLLNHRDIKFDDFEWHWFNLAGYEKLENDLNVLTVTYGEYQWFNLRNLHDTGYDRKGGIIKIFESEL